MQKALTFPAFLLLLDIPIRRTFYSMLTTDSKGNVRAIEKVAMFLKHTVTMSHFETLSLLTVLS